MAPPHKRRRVSYEEARDLTTSFHGQNHPPEPTAGFSHGVEHLSHTRSPAHALPSPQHIEEVHLQIQQTIVSDERVHLHRRQGTATSSPSVLTATLIVAVDTAGITTNQVTLGTSSGYAATTITSTTISGKPVSFPPISSSSLAGSTSDASASGSLSSNGASSTGTARGSPQVSATSTGSASSTESAVSSNATVTPSPSSFAPSASGVVESANITSSVSSNASLGAFAYLATLSDHSVKTITRSSKPYVTTFPDGEVSTIGSISVTPVSTFTSDGVTSTLFSTETPLDQAGGQSTITSTAAGAGFGTATSIATSSTSSPGSHNDNSAPPPASTIAGGVVGGAAGLAVVLLIAMLFLRWYRRRAHMGHHALPPSSAMSPDSDIDPRSRPPGMAERAGLRPLIGAVPAMFRHHDRGSRGPADAAPSERGFTRISGRKLPSSFSPGMSSSSPPPTMPLAGAGGDTDDLARNLSTQSFYRDSAGFYGGEGEAEGEADAARSVSPTAPSDQARSISPEELMTLSPGPQRTPTVHHAGPWAMSPTTSGPESPRASMWPQGSLLGAGAQSRSASGAFVARSDTPTSLDANRSSRFAEDV